MAAVRVLACAFADRDTTSGAITLCTRRVTGFIYLKRIETNLPICAFHLRPRDDAYTALLPRAGEGE